MLFNASNHTKGGPQAAVLGGIVKIGGVQSRLDRSKVHDRRVATGKESRKSQRRVEEWTLTNCFDVAKFG